MSDLRKLPAAEPRVESGPVQFGDDWPGVFLRGDNACWYGFVLKQFLESVGDGADLMQKAMLQGLASDLQGCDVRRLDSQPPAAPEPSATAESGE